MNKNFLKYRNIISLDKDYNLNEIQLNKLIEKKIFIIGCKCPKEDFYTFVKEGENFHVSGTEILYNFYTYHLNHDVVNLILEQLQNLLQKRFKYRYDLFQEQIKFELGEYITEKDKLKYLSIKHSEIWKSLEHFKDPHSRSEFQRFYDLDEEEFFRSDDWLLWIWEESENHHIFKYLSTNENIYNCFKEFIDKWEEYGKVKALSLYCKKLLSILENKTDSIENKDRLTPMEQICFIEKLRDNDCQFSSLNIQDQLNYLNLFPNKTKNSVQDKINALNKLVSLPINEYESLSSSAYARLLFEISGSSLTNLRQDRAGYDLTAIQKDSKYLTSNEIKHNKRFNLFQEKIKTANQKLSIKMKDMGTTQGIPN